MAEFRADERASEASGAPTGGVPPPAAPEATQGARGAGGVAAEEEARGGVVRAKAEGRRNRARAGTRAAQLCSGVLREARLRRTEGGGVGRGLRGTRGRGAGLARMAHDTSDARV